MSPELWEQVQIVVDESLHLPVADRPAFLARACADQPELRREVDSLLAGAEDAQDFIEDPVFSLHADHEAEAAAAAEQRIGHYRILSEVGSGGMGSVYLATRTDDYEKPVALKVLKRGMDTDEIVRRFEHERQILANLDHPNISKLLDGGTTEDGRPYFVMERVEGEPIDRYCDAAKLSTHQRLELFRQVCSAVHFAHQNLVVHRDLKPGNILVSEDGVPKLLDFGIAKLLESEMLSTQTPTLPLLTVAGTGPMTPRYASPEQVRGDTITTSSDIYSLGVLLYKVLTGHRPYRLRDHSLSGLFHAIREQDPIKPSEVVLATDHLQFADGTSVTITPDSVSETRDGSPPVLRRRLAGDLDCIVLKALRKQPKERYGSAEQLSEDIRRHLEGLPVQARKGTFAYQVTKFFRRHSTKVAMASAFLLILLFGSLWRSSQNQAERERQRAAREQQIAESLADLFTELNQLDPQAGEEEDFADSFSKKVSQYVDNLKLAEVLNDQAFSLTNRGGIRTAEILYREALAMKLRLVDEGHPSVIRGMNNLASALEAQGKYREADAIYQKALDLKIQLYGRESSETAISLNNLAMLYQNTGDLEKSEPLINESLEIRRRVFGRESNQVGAALNNRAFLHHLRGDLAAAEADFRQSLHIFRTNVGLDSSAVAQVLRNLATVLQAKGDLVGAEAAARKALGIFRENFKDWRISDAESVLGGCLSAIGRYDEAEPLLAQSYPVIRAAKGINARQTREALLRLETLEELRVSSPEQR
ncbi:MAG: serine/threonine-protein kinase [Acidobacteriota bacterium]